MCRLQLLLNNRQVYHTSMKTIDLDVNTYLTIDPKVGEPVHPQGLGIGESFL